MLMRFIDQDGTEEIISVDSIKRITANRTEENPKGSKTHYDVSIDLKCKENWVTRRYFISAYDWSRLWSKTSGRRDDIWCISMHVLDRDLQMFKENEARHELQSKK